MIVTVDEVKTHLRIQHDEEDDYIAGLIAQAQTAAEDYCRVSFEPAARPPGRHPHDQLLLREPGHSRHDHLQGHAHGLRQPAVPLPRPGEDVLMEVRCLARIQKL